MAIGAALCSKEPVDLQKAAQNIRSYVHEGQFLSIPPLFENQEDYDAFVARHQKATVKKGDIAAYEGPAYLGIDAGSTTIKAALIGKDGQLLHSIYRSNSGNLYRPSKTI